MTIFLFGLVFDCDFDWMTTCVKYSYFCWLIELYKHTVVILVNLLAPTGPGSLKTCLSFWSVKQNIFVITKFSAVFTSSLLTVSLLFGDKQVMCNFLFFFYLACFCSFFEVKN